MGTINTQPTAERKPFKVPPLKSHPVAEFFPLLEGAEFDAFVKDIDERGQHEDILVDREGPEGRVIDGRNRWRACEVLGIKPRVKVWDGQGSIAALSVSLNLRRRHLNATQRAAAAVAVKREYADEAAKRGRAGLRHGNAPGTAISQTSNVMGEAAELAAKDCMIGVRYVYAAEKVYRHDRKLYAAMLRGEKTLSQATHVMNHANEKNRIAKRAASVAAAGSALPSFNIIIGDCLDEMTRMEGRRYRLIFADPPYNEGIDYGKGSKADKLDPVEYLAWCARWIEEASRLLTADGSLWLLISEDYAADFAKLPLQFGLHRQGWIIWFEGFGVYRHHYFGRNARHLFHFVKNPADFVFNASAVMGPSKRQSVYNDVTRANPAGMIYPNVWLDIPRVAGTHPERIPEFKTQLPRELLKRVVGCATEPGDVVLDPFNGSGTTGVEALAAGCRYVGIELEDKWAKAAIQRLIGTSAPETKAKAS